MDTALPRAAEAGRRGRARLASGVCLALSLGWAGPLDATVDGIEFVCPCELELRPATGEARLKFGVRNFRPTVTGALAARIGGYSETRIEMAPLSADTTRRFTHTVRGLSRIVADARAPEWESGGLLLSEGGISVDRVPLLATTPGASPDALVLRSPDFLTDGDGDGVADANERLEGTDPADPQSTPGESTIDILALYEDEYAASLGYAPHTRIHHSMTVANLAYEDSGTNIRLRTVGVAEAAPEDPDHWGSSPPYELQERLLRLHGADLSVYFKGQAPAGSGFQSGGGFAHLNGWRDRGHLPLGEDFHMLATVFYATPPYIVAHEIGHLLGLSHSFDQGNTGTFSWSRGYPEQTGRSAFLGLEDQGRFIDYRGTIMSVGGGYFGFSDPGIDCWGFGTPCGAPRDQWHGADAVTSLDAVRFQVARYRQARSDSDGDHIVDPADAFPLDAMEWRDTDGDGIGNVADRDDDNDSFPDRDDRFPLDPLEWADIDRDGIGDNADAEVPDDDILVPDPALRSIVEESLELPPGTPIRTGDMASIERLRPNSDSWAFGGVKSLEGIQHASNLTELGLHGGHIEDLSPLAGLEKLHSLTLHDQQIRDLGPLTGLTSLRDLNVIGNSIEDLSPLASMANLHGLVLGSNPFDDGELEHIRTLTDLRVFSLNQSNISDIAPLASLPQLIHLYLGSNPRLRNMESVANLSRLQTLLLSDTPVSDLSFLKNLTDLRYLALSTTRVTDYQILSGLPELVELRVAGNAISDLSKFSTLRAIDRLDLADNNISDVSELLGSGILSDTAELELRGNPLSRKAIHEQIPVLEARGVTVHFDAPEFDLQDAPLHEALAEAVGKPGSHVITGEDLRQVRSLDLSGRGIGDLTGLEHATNLWFVNLAHNGIEDLSPLLELANLRQVTLDDRALNDGSLRRDIDALRARGVSVTRAATAEEPAVSGDCQPGLLLGPGEHCDYPGTAERLAVDADGMATFLSGTFGDSIDIGGRLDGRDYDLAASHRGGGTWRIDRVAGRTDAPADDSGSDASPDGGADALGDFDLDDDNGYPHGIVFANGRFHVVDLGGLKVYAYTASGERDAAADFDLDDDHGYPTGIAFANGRFHVVEGIDGKVYAYTASGQRDAAADFDLDDDNDTASGIAFANGRFYVTDWNDVKVYAYTASGQRDAAADFDLDDDQAGPTRITFANDRYYVVDWIRDKVYAYTASGQRAAGFDLDDVNRDPIGIAFANDRFYVVNWNDDKVYAYTWDEGSDPSDTGDTGGQLAAFEAGETLPGLPAGDWTPDVTSGGSFSSSGGAVTVELDSGGYIEEGDYRYTCQSGNGCRIEDRRVTSGSIARTSAGAAPPPSFAAACFPSTIWYGHGKAIAPLTLPPATGGDAPLTYSIEVTGADEEFWELMPRPSLIPGLAFDPATRRIEGTPVNDGDTNPSYGMTYTVTDADGDTDELEFTVVIMHANSAFIDQLHEAMYDNPCDGFLTDSFTDSTGRTIRFRLQFGADWDLSQPRGVELYFHGNATGTEQDMLDAHKWWRPDRSSLDKGMLRAAVASPYSATRHSVIGMSLKNDGERSWLPDDARLIHELLQGDFGGNAAVDRDRIVFTGSSQGPCFINYFLQRYAGVYGGGFHSDCGCLFWSSVWPPRFANPWSPTVRWTPHMASSVAPRFRVFVQSTTGDFLYNSSLAMRDMYRDVLGFETRWDLDAPGGHCSVGATPYGTVFEWLSDTAPVARILGSVSGDHDADGLADAVDPDDDNDGAPDIVDALPLEPREWLDTDADGIGDFLDRDADGDGVENASDPFPLDPLEWADGDGDGIGDNIDNDDDNDGVPDAADSEPLSGPRNDQLAFDHVHGDGLEPRDGYPASPKLAEINDGQPADAIYPTARGDRQSWHFITLGDSANPVFEIMVDTHELGERCEDILLAEFCGPRNRVQGRYETYGEFHEERLHMIYVDRNQNRDLTDDGPPMVMADRERDNVMAEEGAGSATFASTAPGTSLTLNVLYATGKYLPYRMALTVIDDSDSDDLRLGYNVSSYWIGEVAVPDRESVLIGVFDANLDAVFNNGALKFDAVFRVERGFTEQGNQYSATSLRGLRELEQLRDYACVDLNRDGELNDCGDIGAFEEDDEFAPIYAGEPFTLDGRGCTLETAPTGHTVRLDCQ